MLPLALIGAQLGCAPPPEPLPPPPSSISSAPVVSAPPLVVADGGEAVNIALGFQGVSPLYQGYFRTQEWVAQLAVDLGACFDNTVEVIVSYDSEVHIGRIFIPVERGGLRCRPVVGPDGVDLSPLVPVGRALARYRDAVSAARDVRVASFRAGLRFGFGANLCDIWLGGQFPPDGTAFSPCIHLQGHEVCGDGDRHRPQRTLPWPPDPEQSDILRKCLL